MSEEVLSDGDPSGNVAALDGLRGLAVCLVVLHHLNYVSPAWLLPRNFLTRDYAFVVGNGWIGVDIFFVLSGYLITRTIFRTRTAINFYQGFYIRRALRIWPLHAVVLLFVFQLSRWNDYRNAPIWLKTIYWLGVSNYYSAFRPAVLPIVSIFWSLAIEEQFYLFWPTLVRRCRPVRLITILACALLVELALRATPFIRHSEFNVAYRITPLHWDGLVLGSMLAVCIVQNYIRVVHSRVLLLVAAIAGLIGTVLLKHGAGIHCTSVFAFATAALIGFLVLGSRKDFLSRLLSLPTLRLLGRYSYFIYITQTIFFTVLYNRIFSHLGMVGGSRALLLYIVPTVGSLAVLFYFGHLSWAFFEGPLNRLKSRFPYRFA